ncbi:ankyrin repeat and SOCS box protein-like protein [Parachaetomium inaequale]|uniref:Ankyrin repeat and SOCS box protein-like protein n=1 Tax=Parachaetomium inaequale TaxID=2588326 RepID=A0AAN6SKY8_9PEZI|nr:ankyrin repeat and SOCS box protein-like protein [Parachaetomium inaequale]
MNDRSEGIGLPTSGTCEWLFQHNEWKRWLACDGGLLWIKGKPGSGKSTLLRHAEQELKKTRVKKKDLALSFFFHGRGEELQRSPLGMYRSLLCQVLKQEPASLSQLVETFKNKSDGEKGPGVAWKWDTEHLGNHLDRAIDSISESRTIWLFVDALDECGQEGADKVLRHFNGLRRPGLRICVSCRHYPLQNWDGGFEIKVEEQNRADILKYAQVQLRHLQHKTALPLPDLIAAHANGLFIWARLAIDRLWSMEKDMGGAEVEDVIRQTINSIPQDLDDLYTEIVQDIEKTPAAVALLRWVSCAQRPLKLRELWCALIADPDAHPDSQYKEDGSAGLQYPRSNEEMGVKVRTLSHGLLETVASARGRGVVQFIHQTVVDFFRNGGLLLLSRNENEASPEAAMDLAHDHLFRTCVAYLRIHDDLQRVDEHFDTLFSRYAAEFWIKHIRFSQKSQAHLLDYLGWPSNHFVDLWVRHYRPLDLPWPLEGDPDLTRPPRGIGLVHVAARFGLTTSLSMMLERAKADKVDIDAPDRLGRTPLVYAAERGRAAVVESLIEAGACVQTRDYMGATPLHWAALRGHKDIMALLLNNGAQADAEVQGGGTPLAWAIEGGSRSSAELLLKVCGTISACNGRHLLESPTRAAVSFFFVGNPRSASPVDCPWIFPREPCRVWKTPRPWWTFQFVLDPVPDQFILPAMGSIPGSTYGHRTLLLRAVELGQEAIVRMLLDKGASPNLKGIHGWSPVKLAREKGDNGLLRLLEGVKEST